MILSLLTLFAQGDDAAAAAAGGAAFLVLIVELVLIVVIVAGFWKVFEKAGKPGWAAIVPIYNMVVLLEICDKPIWWLLIMICVPCVNIVFAIMLYIELAKRFNQTVVFAVGMALLPMIFIPILGFGSAQYAGAAGQLR